MEYQLSNNQCVWHFDFANKLKNLTIAIYQWISQLISCQPNNIQDINENHIYNPWYWMARKIVYYMPIFKNDKSFFLKNIWLSMIDCEKIFDV